MKQNINREFFTRKRETIIIFLLAGFLMGFQVFTLSTSAESLFLSGGNKAEPNFSALPVSAVENCPDFNPDDDYLFPTCIRPIGSTNVQVGAVGKFFVETYAETPFYFSTETWFARALDFTQVKVSLSPTEQFQDIIYFNIYRDSFGYAMSPTIHYQGNSAGGDMIIAGNTMNNHVGSSMLININATSTPTTPTTPTSTLQSSVSEIPVGWKQNMRINVQNAPNKTDTFRVTADTASVMLFSLSPNGPYSTYIDVPITTNSGGTGITQDFYVKGQSRTIVLSSLPKITACGNSLPCISPFSMKIINVHSLYMSHYYHPGNMSSSNLALDANPKTGGGLRIFPEKKTPNDNADALKRRYVVISALLSEQLPNRLIEFQVYDVDDPSSDDTEIDPNGSSGNDNRSLNHYFVESGESDVSVLTNVNGEAYVTLAVSQQPGDNYRIAAVPKISSANNPAQNNILSNVLINGLELSYEGLSFSAASSNPSQVGAATRMLTVWRKLHLERDSMGAVSGNLVTGQVLSATSDVSTSKVVLSTPGGTGLDKGRFKNGRLYVYNEQPGSFNGYFNVTANGTTYVNVEGAFPETMVGASYTLWDDDDFNLDDARGLMGDNGEDIPAPDTSFLQDSDNSVLNKLAPAYVRPTYDLTGESGNVPFVLNTPIANGHYNWTRQTAQVRSLFNFNNIVTQEDSNFWTVYVLNAYQPEINLDGDPEEGWIRGIVDTFDDQGIAIYTETFHETSMFYAAQSTTVPDRSKDKGILIHEMGHIFNSQHGDGSVMCGLRNMTEAECQENGFPADCAIEVPACEFIVEYSPKTLDLIRSTIAP